MSVLLFYIKHTVVQGVYTACLYLKLLIVSMRVKVTLILTIRLALIAEMPMNKSIQLFMRV